MTLTFFVFHDDLQYTHSDWRNRNKIITAAGATWITIPVGRSEKRLICEVEVKDQKWKAKHKQLIEHNYRRAPFFEACKPLLTFLYDNDITSLSDFNQHAIKHIAHLLGITTEFTDSRLLAVDGKKTERLIKILHKNWCNKIYYRSIG